MNGRTILWTTAAALGLFAMTLAGCPLLPTAEDFQFNLDDIDTSQFFDTEELFGDKEVVIDSADGGCFSFHTGDTACNDEAIDGDITLEPHCSELPPICGNWVATEFTMLDEVTAPPSEGYLTDLNGYEDCVEVPLDQVIVFKLDDGTYAKGIIVEDVYSEGEYGCDHRITIEYVYPMIF